jgi:hypothetical protein
MCEKQSRSRQVSAVVPLHHVVVHNTERTCHCCNTNLHKYSIYARVYVQCRACTFKKGFNTIYTTTACSLNLLETYLAQLQAHNNTVSVRINVRGARHTFATKIRNIVCISTSPPSCGILQLRALRNFSKQSRDVCRVK